MRHIALLGLLLVSLVFGKALAVSFEPLLEAKLLNAALETQTEVQLIDIRSPADYAAGHLPNAVSAPYGQWRGPAHNPGQLLKEAYFQQLVQQLGLTNEHPVVVYSSGADETDFGAAARVYWTLKYLGFTNLALLNGGFKQWQLANLPTQTTANKPSPSNYQVQLNQALVIQQEELLSKIAEPNENLQLLDARPPKFFAGEMKAPTASVGGTIASAQNLPFGQWFNSYDTRLRSASEIQQAVAQQNLHLAPETVSFCNTGHWAATNWFVLSEIAGLPNVRMYPASLAEWTQAPLALPMENTPSRWQQIKTKFAKLVGQ